MESKGKRGIRIIEDYRISLWGEKQAIIMESQGGKCMSYFVLGLQDIDKTKLMVVGGKGANLGELLKIDGILVPDGFCISTEAFKRIIGETSSINELLDQLSRLKVEDRYQIGELCREIRRVIEGIAIPRDIDEEITRFLSRNDEKMLMQCDPAQLQRIYRRPPLQASRIRI